MILNFIILILLTYCFLILSFTFGWYKNKSSKNSQRKKHVSIIIAARNEEDNIDEIINNFNSQNYPKDKIELIIIDDHSTDMTSKKANKFKQNNIKVLLLPDNLYGKKQAIDFGLQHAVGDIILTTDADCSFERNWVNTMSSYFADKNVKLVAGPVKYSSNESFFQKFQSLEFYSLISCGAGAIGIQKPIFCNAANMAYSKDVIEIFNRVSDSKIASGDDVFLLHYLKKTNTNAIKFALDEKAIVTTSSKENISDFLNQRKRWTAKSASYDDLFTLFVSILVLLVNFSFIYVLFDSLFTYNYNFLFFFFAMKFICDYLILKPALIFFKKENLTKWTLLFEFFYSLYVIFIVVMSFTTKFKWKDRIYKK